MVGRRHGRPRPTPYVLVAECVDAYLAAFDFDSDGDVDLADFAEFQAGFGGPPPKPADLDNDGDADLRDFALFQQQFAGPGHGSADLDDDGDVDLADFALFQASFTGP